MCGSTNASWVGPSASQAACGQKTASSHQWLTIRRLYHEFEFTFRHQTVYGAKRRRRSTLQLLRLWMDAVMRIWCGPHGGAPARGYVLFPPATRSVPQPSTSDELFPPHLHIDCQHRLRPGCRKLLRQALRRLRFFECV